MRHIAAFVVLMALPTNPVFGQDLPKLGDQVRVTAPEFGSHGLDRYVGPLNSLTLKTITVGHVEIPRSLVTRFEIRRRKGNAGKGALYGGLIAGVASGAFFASLAGRGWGAEYHPVEGFAAGFILAAVPGAVLGAVIGAFAKSEKWDASSVPRFRPAVTTATGNGVSIGLAVSF